METVADGNLSRPGVGHHHRDHQGAHPPRSACLQGIVTLQQGAHSADPRADDHGHVLVVIVRLEGQIRVGNGLIRGSHDQVSESV